MRRYRTAETPGWTRGNLSRALQAAAGEAPRWPAGALALHTAAVAALAGTAEITPALIVTACAAWPRG